MKRARQRWERRLRIMRINLIGFLILAVVGCAGFRMVRTVLLQNAQELGSSLAGTSASEARNKLTVYETLLSFGAEMVSSRLESWTGAEDVSAWMGRYFQQLEAILGEGNADLYGVIGGEIVAANPWEGDRTYDYTQAEWYQRALESDGGVAFTNVYQDAIYGRPVITISRTCGQEGDVLAMDVFPENFGCPCRRGPPFSCVTRWGP